MYREKILPDKLNLNLAYVDRNSFWFDMKIIFETLTLVVRQNKG